MGDKLGGTRGVKTGVLDRSCICKGAQFQQGCCSGPEKMSR